MAVIEALVLVIVAGIAFIVVTALVFIGIGIHQEERRWTLTQGDAPTGFALLTRRVLGAHCHGRFGGPWPNERPQDGPFWTDYQSIGQDSRAAEGLAIPGRRA